MQAFPQLLVLAGLGAVLLQPLTAGQQFLLDDPAAVLPLLHVIQLAAGLFNAGVEQGNAGQFIDQSAPVAVAHRHDAGHIPLHHHIAALGIDAQSAQLGLQLLQVAGHTISAVAGAVGAPRHHPQLAGDGPFVLIRADPGPLLRRLQPLLGGVGAPVAEIEAHADGGLGRLTGLEHTAVDQIRQTVGAHSAAGCQAEAEQNAVQDVALPGSVRSGDHGESLLQRDRHRPAEGFELCQPDLIDMNQQGFGLSASRK